MLVEAFVVQTAVEGFGEAVLGGLARRAVVPFNTAILLSGEDRARDQLGTVVAHNHARLAGTRPIKASLFVISNPTGTSVLGHLAPNRRSHTNKRDRDFPSAPI